MSWGSGHLFKVCASNHLPAVDGAGAIQWVHSPGVRGRCIVSLDGLKPNFLFFLNKKCMLEADPALLCFDRDAPMI